MFSYLKAQSTFFHQGYEMFEDHEQFMKDVTAKVTVHCLIYPIPDTPDYLRSEEHTSELQSRPHISYAIFCLKKKTNNNTKQKKKQQTIT